jgi:hypothetical protein
MELLRRLWKWLSTVPGWVYAAFGAAIATALAVASRAARVRWNTKIRTMELDAAHTDKITTARADAAQKQGELDKQHAAELARLELTSRIIADATSLEDVARLLNQTMGDE